MHMNFSGADFLNCLKNGQCDGCNMLNIQDKPGQGRTLLPASRLPLSWPAATMAGLRTKLFTATNTASVVIEMKELHSLA